MTSRQVKTTIVRNAVANVVRGSAAALVALLLPPFLSRQMAPDAFGAWYLVLQVAAYVGYLDFGIQTAVSRFVAHATEAGDTAHRDRIVSTSFVLLSASGFVASIIMVVVAIMLPRIFHQVPPLLMDDVRWSLLIVSGSLALGLPASVFSGICIGLQRNEIPAAIIGGSKVLGAVLVAVIVRLDGSLTAMATALALVNVGSYVLQYVTYRRAAPSVRLSPSLASRSAILELVDYCTSLTVWAFGLLLVTGLDLTIVGAHRFNEVAYYSVAATAVTFLAGFYNAIFGALMPHTAVLHARGERGELGRMVVSTTRYGVLLLLATGVPLILGAKPVLSVWVGPAYASRAAVILQLLVAANVIRLSVTPYVVAMIGTGQQRRLILTPLIEGATNVICSVVAVRYFGAVGVAVGTLIGAVVGVSGHCVYNMPRTDALRVRISEYLGESLLRPIACIFPALLVVAFTSTADDFGSWSVFLYVMAALGTLTLFWTIGLIAPERHAIRKKLAARTSG